MPQIHLVGGDDGLEDSKELEPSVRRKKNPCHLTQLEVGVAAGVLSNFISAGISRISWTTDRLKPKPKKDKKKKRKRPASYR
jgi:hypothetical protein